MRSRVEIAMEGTQGRLRIADKRESAIRSRDCEIAAELDKIIRDAWEQYPNDPKMALGHIHVALRRLEKELKKE